MLKLIQPISKKGQVVAAIKEGILNGSIQPGDQMVESRLAQELGSGIPLVREALIELEHQGFVQKIPYKGTIVTKLGAKEIRQIFNLRIELEVLAIVWAKAQITDADVTELRALIQKMERAARELDLSEFYEQDLAFHRRLWAISGNTYLVDALERVVVPLFAFFVMKTKRERESYLVSATEHMEIVDALLKKSARELGKLMRGTLAEWEDDMMKLLFAEDQTQA